MRSLPGMRTTRSADGFGRAGGYGCAMGLMRIMGLRTRRAVSGTRAIRRHLLTASAIYHRVGGGVIVSHQSAVLQHGIQVSDLDLSRVHLTRASGRGRSGREVCLHAARPAVLDPVEVG